MYDFALFVCSDFEDARIQAVAHPTDGEILLGNVAPPIKPIRLRKQLTRFFESYAPAGISPEALAFSRVETKPHQM
jgi:hypothetical protein